MKRHFDIVALIAGGFFGTLGILFVLEQRGSASIDAGVVIPVGLILLGAGSAVSGSRRRRSRSPEQHE